MPATIDTYIIYYLGEIYHVEVIDDETYVKVNVSPMHGMTLFSFILFTAGKYTSRASLLVQTVLTSINIVDDGRGNRAIDDFLTSVETLFTEGFVISEKHEAIPVPRRA